MNKSRIKRLKKEIGTLTEEDIDDLIYNCTFGVENSFRMFEYKRNLKENK